MVVGGGFDGGWRVAVGRRKGKKGMCLKHEIRKGGLERECIITFVGDFYCN